MNKFSQDLVKLWGHILMNLPVNGDNNFYHFACFCRDARALQGLAIAECNGDLTPRQKARQRTLTAKVQAYARSIGCEATVEGDPRGWVVKLHWPDLGQNAPYNTWGGVESGWGVG